MASVIDLFRAEGRAQGIAEGRAEGIAEGRAEGRAETAIATILNLVRDGDLPRAKAELLLRRLAEQAVIADAQLQSALRDLG